MLQLGGKTPLLQEISCSHKIHLSLFVGLFSFQHQIMFELMDSIYHICSFGGNSAFSREKFHAEVQCLNTVASKQQRPQAHIKLGLLVLLHPAEHQVLLSFEQCLPKLFQRIDIYPLIIA